MNKLIRSITLRFRILILACFVVNICFATTYYVSPTGDDTGSGAVSSPFQTITKAASMVSAGDTIFISEGTYAEKNIIPGASGTENAFIVFKPIPGTGDVIIKHPATAADDTPVFQLSNRNFIWIEGFQFKDFSYGRASIYISAGEGNVVINNRFENLGNGEVATWNGNQVVGLFNSSRNVVCNNYFSNITGDGINVNSQNSVDNLVCNNTFLGFKGKLRDWGGQYLYSRAIDVQDMSNGNNVIAFNYAKDVIHHIWLDRDGSNNVVLRNYGDTGSGMVFNESRCANNVVQENISLNMKVGYMSAYYETTGWTIEPRWINNVAFKNETGFTIHKSERDEFRNNISYNNTNYNLIFTEEAMSNGPHIFKNNLWYSDNKINSIEFKGTPVSVPAFQSAVGETGGLSVDPQFTNITPGAEDFTLQASSPAKNAGDNGLDLGAYALYPKSAVGWDPSLQISDVLIYFDEVISSAERGDQVQLVIKLSRASTEEITVNVVPIAGDAASGDDFELSSPTVIFQPGEISKTVSIAIGEDDAQHDELVAFRLENSVNAQAGARNLRLLRIKKTPVLTAYAGPDQIVRDSDNSGSENVILDGSGSNDPDGTVVSYVWSVSGNEIATGENPTVTLNLGVHTITLTVTDNDGNTDTNEVTITVVKDSGVWLEAECGIIGSLWNIETDEDASNEKYVTIKTDNNSTAAAPADVSGLLTYTFDVSESGIYTLYTRVICPSPDDDSFWLKMDNGSFASWNDITPSTSWTWTNYSTTYNLNEGSHTLTIGYREDGAKLDKLWITNTGAELSDEGSPAGNCGVVNAVNEDVIMNIGVYPNPVSEELHIILSGSPSEVSIYNISGEKIFNRNVQTQKMIFDMTDYSPGVYFIKVINQYQTTVRRIIKQ